MKNLDKWDILAIRACKRDLPIEKIEYRINKIFNKRNALPHDSDHIYYRMAWLLNLVEEVNPLSQEHLLREVNPDTYIGDDEISFYGLVIRKLCVRLMLSKRDKLKNYIPPLSFRISHPESL